jgi:hypothetical protein
MASLLESCSAFSQRAHEIGLGAGLLAGLVSDGIDSFAKLGFSCNYVQGSTDEKPFLDMLTRSNANVAPGAGDCAAARRLYYEAHVLLSADARQRLERTEDDKPLRLHHSERETRLVVLEKKLAGMHLTGELEISNQLVDIFAQIASDGVLKYVGPEKCTRRSQEIECETKPVGYKFDAPNGKLSVTRVDETMTADTSDLLRLRFALQRRGLAMEVAFLLSYSVHEEWLETIFGLMMDPPLPNYSKVNEAQVLRADKELFVMISRHHRGGFKIDLTGRTFVLDAAWAAKVDSVRIQHMLMPMAAAGRQAPAGGVRPGPTPPNPTSKRQVKLTLLKAKHAARTGGGKGSDGPKGGGKGKGKTSMPAALAGGQSSIDGSPICYNFNLPHGCALPVDANNKCAKGLHVCCAFKCGKPHSFQKHT